MVIYDALIVGSGPAGSILAGQLAKNEFSTLVLEANKSVKRKVCGEYLCPLGVALLKDRGLSHTLLGFERVHGMDIFSPRGLKVDSTFPETETFNEKGLSLNREVFDSSLVEYAKECGSTFLFGHSVKSFSYNGTFWEVLDYKGNTYGARLLVGADGRRSKVAKGLGVDRKSDSNKVAIHCWKKGDYSFERKGEMHLYEDGSYIGVDPISNGEVNLSLVCESSIVKKYKSPKEVMNSYIKKSDSLSSRIGLIGDEEDVYTVSPISHKVSKAISHQAALIGDAAGFIDPLTGEGIFNAIWMSMKLSDCLKSDRLSLFDYSLSLKKYEQSRVSFFRQKVLLNKFFQWLIRREKIIHFVAIFLRGKKSRADTFVGIIGNIYKPITGLLKILQ